MGIVVAVVFGLLMIVYGVHMIRSAYLSVFGRAIIGEEDRTTRVRPDRVISALRGLFLIACGVLVLIGAVSRL